MEERIFKLEDVYFSYLNKFPALCGINMDIYKGEKIAILGANGSGKSTLLQMLDGLIFPERGKILGLGKELNEANLANKDFARLFRSKVGFVFQNPEVQLFCPTVEEDIAFGPLHLGVSDKETRRRIDELADILGIKNLLMRSPHQLSIGEKRKVAIASTLALDPDILLLDEPTAGLDPQTSRHIVDIILEANLKGKTIITATHDLHVVEEIASNIYILNNEKRIAGFGPTKEILSNSILLQENNLIHVHMHKHHGVIHLHPHQHLDHHA
jgi:cobalt/nickel transport system ATP-binding protein